MPNPKPKSRKKALHSQSSSSEEPHISKKVRINSFAYLPKRITRSSGVLKSKPMTKEEGAAISLSDNSISGSSDEHYVQPPPKLSEGSSSHQNPLDMLARACEAQKTPSGSINEAAVDSVTIGADVQEEAGIQSPPNPSVNIISSLEANHMVNLGAALHHQFATAFKTMDQLLGTKTYVPESFPASQFSPLPKPVDNPLSCKIRVGPSGIKPAAEPSSASVPLSPQWRRPNYVLVDENVHNHSPKDDINQWGNETNVEVEMNQNKGKSPLLETDANRTTVKLRVNRHPEVETLVHKTSDKPSLQEDEKPVRKGPVFTRNRLKSVSKGKPKPKAKKKQVVFEEEEEQDVEPSKTKARQTKRTHPLPHHSSSTSDEQHEHLSPKSLFSSPLAYKRYFIYAGKVGHTPKGFSSHILAANPSFKAVIENLGWEKLCSVPEPYNLDWVREFYTEISTYNRMDVIVRKTPVSYTPQDINNLLGLVPPVDSEFDRLQAGETEEDLEDILAKVAVEGTTWSYHGKCRVLKTNALRPEANVWFYFMRHTLHPTTHDTNLCMERVYLLYCIMESKPFDVGKLICGAIRGCVERTKGPLPYPSIIHKLMEKAKVVTLPSDTFSKEKTEIDKQTITRLMKNTEHVPDVNNLEALGAMLEGFKADVLKSMDDQTVVLKAVIKKKSKKMMGRLKKIEDEMELLKQDRMQWNAYKQQKDMIMRNAWRQGPHGAGGLPPPPASLFQMHRHA